ncbi:MAG: hypothetical protein COA57_15725, partial [Flavobacteriales bacterium]
LPLKFTIDPAISYKIKHMTLAYTLFDITDTEKYKELKENVYSETISNIEKEISQIKSGELVELKEYEFQMNIKQGLIEFTEFGKGFLNACMKDIELNHNM